MNWTQTIVLAAAVLVAGFAIGQAQAPGGIWFIGNTGDLAWIAAPDGRMWNCQKLNLKTTCERVHLP